MKITKKELKIRFTVFDIGYGLLDELLCMENPVYYCERTQGWAFDVFIFDDIALTSGYTAFGKKVDREVLKGYNYFDPSSVTDDEMKELSKMNDWFYLEDGTLA